MEHVWLHADCLNDQQFLNIFDLELAGILEIPAFFVGLAEKCEKSHELVVAN